ncbi:MlaA family lipoprotein [Rhodopila sp.]|uniref:MlaA family lipoprotein n=1 Tax=Rhodopila sp. TaxID=2480087 RepID=UPI002B5FE21B|nr:VacJ family lipoprotein [Rhodopila sp.]HVZ09191.1 VacJ family lipoprotein [Rhodopila sp.]
MRIAVPCKQARLSVDPCRHGAVRHGLCVALQLVVALLLGMAGCATAPPADDPEASAEFKARNDPFEPANRAVFAFNNAVDSAVLRPTAKAYEAVLPDAVRESIHNLLGNLGGPARLANDMLQGKPRRAGDTAMRFAINSTLGVAGLFDVAAKLGYPDHGSDGGLTLASWGVPDGPYVVLPLIGPSSARDATGYAATLASDPFIWIGQGAAVIGLKSSRIAVRAVDERARHATDLDAVKQTALDPYATFRSLYRQSRAAELETLRADDRATVPAWFPQPEK